ncbi:MAG: hypothetical protein ACI4JY_02260 [Oscillospiraceae bacterium]
MRNWNPLEPILFFRRLNQNKSLRSYALSSRKWVAKGHFSVITTAPAQEMGSRWTFLRDNHRSCVRNG